jgi:hypothetical protein
VTIGGLIDRLLHPNPKFIGKVDQLRF